MKNIHITESQLAMLKKMLKEAYTVDGTRELEQNGYNAKQAAQELFNQNPNLRNDVNKGEATVGFNPAALAEDIDEVNNRHTPYGERPQFGDLDYNYESEENYDEVCRYLQDISMDPNVSDILWRAVDGRNEDVHELLDYIEATTDMKIHPNALRQALASFGDEHQYGYAMEGKMYTKKQLMEAKMRKLKSKCVKYSKSDLLK